MGRAGDLSAKKVSLCAVTSVLLLISPSYAKSAGKKMENRSAFGEVRGKSKVPLFRAPMWGMTQNSRNAKYTNLTRKPTVVTDDCVS